MKWFFLLAITLWTASTALAQLPPPPSPAAGAPTEEVKKFRGWPSIKALPAKPGFVSLVGRFRVGLPGNIQGFAALSPKQLRANASGQEFTWRFSDAYISGFFLDFPVSDLAGTLEDLARFTSNSEKTIASRAPGSKLISETSTRVNGIATAYQLYQLEESKFISINYFLDKKRLYQFNSEYKDRATEDVISAVFKTFSLITQAEIDRELQKKYDELKPAPLPQSPVVLKQTSDAADDGLKGKVKKVVTENEDLSGTWSMQGRKMSSVAYYDESGAQTQQDSYDSQGQPFQITVYGYVDGMRVSNSAIARYEYDPPPAAGPPPGAVKPARKSDPRYEYGFKYKYENGKLVERQMIFSNGEKGMRYAYIHSENGIEELVYSEDGKLNQRYLSIFDANGNEIEQTIFGVVNFDIYGDRKYRYTYEFDEKGNWTKRITSQEVTEDGVKKWMPYSVHYRQITYH